MTLKRTGEETHIFLLNVRRITLFDEPVLPVDNGVTGQYPDGFEPGAVDGFVLRRGDGKEFGEFHLVGYGDIRIFREDAVMLHREEGEFTFQRSGF
jgi:hypothetical protein